MPLRGVGLEGISVTCRGGSLRDPVLGTLRSWWVDAALAGALCSPAAVLPSLVGSRDLTSGLILAGAGALFGACCGPVAYAIASYLFSTGASGWRALTFAVGPALGALGALVIPGVASWIVDGRPSVLRIDEIVMLSSFGGLLVGPPWVAYLGVRAAGRTGRVVVACAPLWAAVVGAAFLTAIEIWLALR